MVNKGIQDLFDIALASEVLKGNRNSGGGNEGCGYVILASPILIEIFFYVCAVDNLCRKIVGSYLNKSALGDVGKFVKNMETYDNINIAVIICSIVAYILIHYLSLKNKKLMYAVLVMTFIGWFAGLMFDGCIGYSCFNEKHIHFTLSPNMIFLTFLIFLVKMFEFWMFGKFKKA